jgi:hypothetical protein
MRFTYAVLAAAALALSLCQGKTAHAQCPAGLISVGRIYGEGSFGSNLVTYKEILLPAGARIDTSYHQPALSPPANGKSDAHSRLVVSEVPAGIFIVPGGDDSANHGWAVGDGPEPRIQLVPATWDSTTNTISQYKFGIRLYCTTGSGEADRWTGGCNVHVDVCYKPIPQKATAQAHKAKAKKS